MLCNIPSSRQAIMPQITVGGDLIVNLSGDGWAVVAVVAVIAFTAGKLLK